MQLLGIVVADISAAKAMSANYISNHVLISLDNVCSGNIDNTSHEIIFMDVDEKSHFSKKRRKGTELNSCCYNSSCRCNASCD